MATILVVDDVELNRRIIVKLLNRYKHQVSEAGDGVEALEKVKAAPPDLVFIDMLMPRMDGHELVRQLRANKQTAHLPIIVYTTLQLARTAQELAQGYGISDILTKPSKPEIIIRAVDNALGLPFKLANPRDAAPQRLEALLEFSNQLKSERDPQRSLEDFCERARKIIGAKCSFLGILDERDEAGLELRHFLTSGIEAELAYEHLLPTTQQLLKRSLAERNCLSVRGEVTNPEQDGSPAPVDRYNSLLCAPIYTPQRPYGWICLVDKLGILEFGEEDERVLGALAAQVASAYENLTLDAEWQYKTEQLKHEHTATLESYQREREAFSHSIAYDLRNSLHAIAGNAWTLLEGHSANLNQDGRQLLKQVFHGTAQTERLLADLLIFSQLGRKEMEMTIVDLESLAHNVAGELRKLEPTRSINIKIQRLAPAQGDQAMLKQMLISLLANAFKFTRGRTHATVEVGLQREENRNVYYVKDNGVGFDMQQVKKLFGVFQRLHRVEDFEGNGIGLAIVRRVIERHGGCVWAASQAEAGATFYFTLPEEQAATKHCA